MGLTNSKIWKLIFGRRNFTICMMGLESVGKTTILYRLHLGEAIATVPTIGFNIETVRYKRLRLTIYDVSGSEHTRRYWKTYYSTQKVHGIIFVIDAEDTERIIKCKEEIYYLVQQESLRGVPLLILANKQDLPNSMSVSDIFEKLELFRIKDRQWHIQATCALTGDGIDQAMARFSQMLTSHS